MIESARSTDCTPPSRVSGSESLADFGSIDLRRITFLFIATCLRNEPHSPLDKTALLKPDREMPPRSVRSGMLRCSEQARAARPFVLGAQYLDRQFGRISVGRNA